MHPTAGRQCKRGHRSRQFRAREASDSVTTGLKCAPEIGPNVKIRVSWHSAGCQSVGKQSYRNIAAREPFAHNAGTYDRRQKECGSQSFRGEAAR